MNVFHLLGMVVHYNFSVKTNVDRAIVSCYILSQPYRLLKTVCICKSNVAYTIRWGAFIEFMI